MFEAKVIADSLNDYGNRLISAEIVFPRYILAEFNTHKMLSKSSASSRAIPFTKTLQSVTNNPFTPMRYMKDHPGMQGTDYFTDEEIESLSLKESWLHGRNLSIGIAEALSHKGLTKQLCNRLIEPYMWHKVLSTGTEWENFFALRAHGAAEIHMEKLAQTMLDVFNESTPKHVVAGEWHLPYGDQMDEEVLQKIADVPLSHNDMQMLKVKVSTARCGRTSYTVVGSESKKHDHAVDIDMYENRLLKPGHMSPMEHPGLSMNDEQFHNNMKRIVIHKDEIDYYVSINPPAWYDVIKETGDEMVIDEYGWCGNFRGFIPHRKQIRRENRTDSRLKKYYTIQ